MAGGKVSPRQKMINMMYLVLLALLAMNVSAEILNAFENIRQKLSISVQNSQENVNAFIDNMKEEINDEIKNENKRTNAGLLDTLDQVKQQTSQIIELLDKHIVTLRDSISGVIPETGELKRKDDTEHNLQYWMGQGAEQERNDKRGAGQAYGLHQALDKYFSNIMNVYNGNVKEASDKLKPEDILIQDPDKGDSHDGTKKTWERYTFEGPLIANLATLEALKLDVYEAEKSLLDLLNGRLGVATFKINKVVPVNAPTATIVPAGLQFQTKLYVAMSSDAIKPSFSSSSGKIDSEDGGNSAVLTIPASGSVIPKGKKEGLQKYSATIRVPKATGGFDILPVEGQFTVRTPEIVVTSAAVQVLYRNCGNDINVDVPALGEYYNPVIKGSNAQVIQSKKGKVKFRVIPTARECILNVSSVTNGKTTKIGNVNYKVIKPPKPTIDMAINGKRTAGTTPVPKTSKVLVKVVPDNEFKGALPEDASYGITSVDVLAQLSLGPPQKVNSTPGGICSERPIQISLGTRVRQAPSNTKVYIRLNEIYRRNFKGQNIPDKRFSEVERTLSLVVK